MIRFKYVPDFRHWRALNVHFILRQFRLLIIVSLVVLFCFVMLPFAHRMAGRDVGIWETYRWGLGALWLPGIVAFLLACVCWGVHSGWKKSHQLREEREYVFDEAGVNVIAQSFSGRLDWQHLKEADLARGLVMIKSQQNQFYYFPKAIVPDWDAFRTLVEKYVKATKRFRRGE